MRIKMMGIVLITLFCLGAVVSGPVLAESYPSKPLTLIIPFGPGGSHDMNARAFTSVIPTYLGQPVVVKLMPGAGGQTGTAAAVRARPDGYTLLFTHNYLDQLQPLLEELPYDTNATLETVARVNFGPGMVFVREDSPWKSLDELLAYGKKNPGKLKFATSGNWGAVMTMGAIVLSQADVQANYVPYQGGGPAIQSVLAGDADLSINFPGTLIPLHKAGKIRILSISGEERHKELPDVPSTKELDLPALNMERFVMAPKGIAKERMQILREAFEKLNSDKTFMKLMERLGENAEYMSGPDYEVVRVEQKKAYQALIEQMSK